MWQRHHAGRARRGFTIIGLILVLAIILILVGKQMGGDDPAESVARHTEQRGKDAACALNRSQMKTSVTAWRIEHPNEPLTVEALQRDRRHIPRCPEGGEYSFGPDGTLYCSVHDPMPAPDTVENQTAPPAEPAGPAAGILQNVQQQLPGN